MTCDIDAKKLEAHKRAIEPMKNTHTLELYRDRKKEHRFRFRAANGNIVFNGGEGYKRKGTMMKTIVAIENAFLDGTYNRKDF